MREKIVDILKTLRIVFIMLLISAVLWPINRNIAVLLGVYTGLFIVFVFCIISILKTIRTDTEVPVSSVVVVMFYSFMLLVPTIKLYSDLPDFFNGNLSVEEGQIERTFRYQGYLDVDINNMSISFWDPTVNYEDFPDDSTMKIYYLPRSKHGVDFELVKE